MTYISEFIKMSNTYQKLGEKIRTARKAKKITQEKLAELVGVDVRTIVAVEAGKRNPTLKTINKIAKALDVQASSLL